MKFLKLSLVASVALGACVSTSFAAPLEEAIKGVDVSGYLRYRYQDDRYTNQNFQKRTNSDGGVEDRGSGNAQHLWRAESIFKTPVVDALSLSLGLRYDGSNNVNHGKGVNPTTTTENNVVTTNPNYPNAFLGSGLGAGYDSTLGVSVFSLNVSPEGTATNVTLGKQYLSTPVTNPTEGDRGVGILATNSDVPGLTLALGAFDSWSLDDMSKFSLRSNAVDKNLYVLAAIYGADLGAAGNLGVQGWFFNVTDVFKYLGFIQLDYSISVVNFALQYGIASVENKADKAVWNVLSPNTRSTTSGNTTTITPLAPTDKAGIAEKNDLFDAKLGVDLKSINVPLTAYVGYITNFADGTTVSFDDEGKYNKAGQIWFQNSATGVSIGAFGNYGYTPYNASKDLNVIYADIGYAIPVADKTITLDVGYVQGTNKISDIPGSWDTTNGEALNTYSTKINFMEISPRVTYKHSKALTIYAFYSMLDTKNKSDGVEEGVPTATTTTKEKRNRLRVEARYNF